MALNEVLATGDALYAGRGYDSGLYGVQKMKGRPVSLLTKVSLGAPKLGVIDAIIKAATSTEMPNNATKTYTAGSGVASPYDSADLPSTTSIVTRDGTRTVWALDVPRNIQVQMTHNSSLVACTVTITGYDKYRGKMVETLTVTATGTDKTVQGVKAFAYVYTVAIVSAGNATTNTANIGFGAVLGLPYYLAEKSDLLSTWFNDAVDSATVVAGVTSTASATSGDVRGTVTLAGTLDGAKTLRVWMHVSDANAASRNGLLGIPHYAG